MLWAGQPDGDNSYWALERLLRRFRRSDEATLVFRAHPRDEAYQSGQYEGLLARFPMRVIDSSDYPDAIDLYCASDLVMTQFSSAGIEASFLGVPALFVLFDDLGKHWLRSFKGYDLPPWCQDYCTFLIETEDDANDILEQALFDMVARDEVCTRFQHRFGSKTDCVQEIGKLIRDVVGN